MKKQTSLKIILIISIAGILFSGYLSYAEIFQKLASFCPSGICGNQIAGIPVCIYGLIMYLIIFTLSILGLNAKK
jgi:uncharacterized membrane protein